LISCNGVNYCSNQGNCIGPNECQCEEGWELPDCSIANCSGCPANGFCTTPWNCQCPQGTFPPDCLAPPPPSCEGADNCTGNGICLGPNICICVTGWEGFNCSIPICDILVCVAGQGTCIAPNECECEPGFSGLTCEIPKNTISPTSNKSVSASVLILAIVIPVVVLLAAGIFVWWFVTRKLKQVGRRQRPKPIEPKYQVLVFGDYLEKEVHPAPSSFQNKWNIMTKLLIEDPQFTFVQKLVSSSPISDLDDLARNILYFFECHGQTQTFFSVIIKSEVESTDNEGSVFRANSFATKMFRVYSKMHGLKYLFSVLSIPILELKGQIEQENVTLEVDPNKLEEGDDTASNRWQLLLITQKLFTAIIRSANEIPPALRNVIYTVKEEVTPKYPNLLSKSLGAFMFLRFYCPAIIAPQAYGLLKDPPDPILQRDLVLLSKILQNLANQQEFGKKEVGLEKLNEFIQDNKNNLANFLNQVSQKADSIVKLEIPDRVQKNTLGYLCEYIKDNAKLDQLSEPLLSQVKELVEKLKN
jgi:hypothetical protein